MLFQHSHDILEDILRDGQRCQWCIFLPLPVLALDPPLPSSTERLVVTTCFPQWARDSLRTSTTARTLCLGIERVQPSLILLVHTVSKSSSTRTRLFHSLRVPHIVDRLVIPCLLVESRKVCRLDKTSRVGCRDMVIERSIRSGGRGIRLGARSRSWRSGFVGRARVNQRS